MRTGGALPVVSVAVHIIKFSLARVQSARENDAGFKVLGERCETVLAFSKMVCNAYFDCMGSSYGAFLLLFDDIR